jgi:hypothetical protein
LHVGRVGAGVDPEDGHGAHGFYLALCHLACPNPLCRCLPCLPRPDGVPGPKVCARAAWSYGCGGGELVLFAGGGPGAGGADCSVPDGWHGPGGGGARVWGEVAEVRRVGVGIVRETASMTLRFTELQAGPAGRMPIAGAGGDDR